MSGAEANDAPIPAWRGQNRNNPRLKTRREEKASKSKLQASSVVKSGVRTRQGLNSSSAREHEDDCDTFRAGEDCGLGKGRGQGRPLSSLVSEVGGRRGEGNAGGR